MIAEEKITLIHFLMDKLYDEYKEETARKEKLESKALGFYTILGIILADIIALQIAFKSCENELLSKINIGILIILGIIYLIFIILNFISYKPKKRQNLSLLISQNWNAYVKITEIGVDNKNQHNRLDDFVMFFREDLKEKIKDNQEKNNNLVFKIKIQSILCLLSGILLFLNIILYIIYFCMEI